MGIAADNPGIAADNLGIIEENLGIETDADARVDNPNIKTNADKDADNSGIIANNKVHAISFSLLHYAFFSLPFSSKSLIASLQSSLPFLSSTTLLSKKILLYSVILEKQGVLFFRYPIDKI